VFKQKKRRLLHQVRQKFKGTLSRSRGIREFYITREEQGSRGRGLGELPARTGHHWERKSLFACCLRRRIRNPLRKDPGGKENKAELHPNGD